MMLAKKEELWQQQQADFVTFLFWCS